MVWYTARYDRLSSKTEEFNVAVDWGNFFGFLYVSPHCKPVILGCFVGGDGLLPGFSVLLQSLICVFYNASAG